MKCAEASLVASKPLRAPSFLHLFHSHPPPVVIQAVLVSLLDSDGTFTLLQIFILLQVQLKGLELWSFVTLEHLRDLRELTCSRASAYPSQSIPLFLVGGAGGVRSRQTLLAWDLRLLRSKDLTLWTFNLRDFLLLPCKGHYIEDYWYYSRPLPT